MTHNFDDFLAQWAANGEFSELDQLDFRADTTAPVVGADVELRWHGTGGLGSVNIYKNGQLWLAEQAANGHHQLPIASLDTILLRAELGAISRELRIAPAVSEPKITRLKINSEIYTSEPIVVNYRVSDAERIEIQCEAPSLGYSQLQTYEGNGSQQCEFIPSESGEYTVTITAYSQHAAISDRAIKSISQSVVCRHAPAKIVCLNASKNKALWGEKIAITWQVDNAEELWLVEGNAEPRAINQQTETMVEAPAEPCRVQYRLIAINRAGDSVEKSISVNWSFPAPVLHLSATEKRIGLGETFTLQWQVSNVQQWWFEAEVNSIKHRLHINHNRQEQIFRPRADTTYYLVGIGLDGKRIEKQVKVGVNTLPSWGGVDSLYKGLDYKI